MTVVGQCLGAGHKDEAIYYIKKLTAVAEVVIIASCALVFLATKPVTILGGMEPESAKMCLYMVGWITVVKPIVWTLPFFWAALGSAAFFGLVHGNWAQGIYAALMGLILAWLYEKKNRLWEPVLFHSAANLTAMLMRGLLWHW